MIKRNSITLLLIYFSIFSINHCYAVTVGDSYGGGTVFCVSKTPDINQCVTEGSGDYGLIMANEDQVNFDSNPKHGVTWSSTYKEIGPGARSRDNGADNTAAIIAAFPEDNPGNNAAWLCHNYKDPIEGHTDWYLPSRNELNKMYLYAKAHNLIGKGCSGSKPGGIQCLVGGRNEDFKLYWSSFEYPGAVYACSQFFGNGYSHNHKKAYYYFGARAIRAFNNLPLNLNQSQLTQQIEGNDRHVQPIDLLSQRILAGSAEKYVDPWDAAAVMNEVDVIKSLLDDYGADINFQNAEKQTALMEAAHNGSVDTVGLLIERGAKHDLRGNRGETALMLAVESGNIDVVRLLVDNGANVNSRDDDGNSALQVAETLGNVEIVGLLRDVMAKTKGKRSIRMKRHHD